MTRRRQVLIAVAAAAALLSVSYLAVRPSDAEAGVPIPVCADDVPAGTRIEASMLTTAVVPAEAVPEGAVLAAEDAVGLRTSVRLRPGEMLSRDRLSADAKGLPHPGAAQGRRIVAIALRAEDAAGWWLTEGNLVDVHLLFGESGSEPLHEVLPGIRVAAVLDAEGLLLGNGAKGGTPAILCLDVDTAQAARLAEADWEGRIKAIIVNETMS